MIVRDRLVIAGIRRMRVVSALLALIVPGCGRLSFEAGNDAVVPTFTVERELAELRTSEVQTDDPTLTADELQIFFASARTGNENISTARRATRDEAFSAATEITAFSTLAEEGSPELTADGLTLYISTNRFGDEGNPFVSMRTSTTAEFVTLTNLTDPVNTSDEEFSLTPSADHLSLYFQHLDSDGVRRLYASTRASTSEPWPTGARVFPDDPFDSRNPFPSTDGLALYFASNAPSGIAGAGALQIFVALRARNTDPWGAPQVVASLVDAYSHGDPWISPDGARLYFARRSDFDLTDSRLYVATRVD